MMLTISSAAQMRLGRRYGKWAKTPWGENREGRDLAGCAKVPPIAGPMIVPIDHTNGITAYARAFDISLEESSPRERPLTFMLWFFHELADHCLNYPNVAICIMISDRSI